MPSSPAPAWLRQSWRFTSAPRQAKAPCQTLLPGVLAEDEAIAELTLVSLEPSSFRAFLATPRPHASGPQSPRCATNWRSFRIQSNRHSPAPSLLSFTCCCFISPLSCLVVVSHCCPGIVLSPIVMKRVLSCHFEPEVRYSWPTARSPLDMIAMLASRGGCPYPRSSSGRTTRMCPGHVGEQGTCRSLTGGSGASRPWLLMWSHAKVWHISRDM